MKSTKTPTIIKALQLGLEVNGIFDDPIALRDGIICIKRTRTSNGHSEIAWLGIDCDLAEFIEDCESMDEKEYSIIVANVVLNSSRL